MIASAWLLLSLSALSSPTGGETPPGLLLVKGGHTKIGSTADEVEKLVLAREELRLAVAGETPQFTADVADFFLMPTEVTNEQYAEFVRATGAKPPRSWAVRALQAGQVAFLEEQARAKQAAKASGAHFESAAFDPEAWWEQHWQSAQWEIPASEHAYPVVFVNYADAQRYARWAGLRLMTELEYQRAARGDSARIYPWGDEWDDKKFCQSLHSGKDLSAPVGSFAPGAVGGVFDLAGNVWEWTSSAFEAFPGYQPLRVVAKANHVIDCLAPFNPEQRVTVGGSFQTDKIGVRVATRRYTDPDQSTNALGFRCAASPTSGMDAARWILEQDLRTSLVSTADFEPSAVSALRRWETAAGEVKVPGYTVIHAYEQVLACPRRELPAPSSGELGRQTLKSGPVFIGLVSVPRPLLDPELAAGTYLVAWRAAGASDDRQQGMTLGGQDPPPAHDAHAASTSKDGYVFYGLDGTLQATLPAPPVTTAKPRAGSVQLLRAGDPALKPGSKATGDELLFTFAVPSANSRGKAFYFDVPVIVAAGALGDGWK